jgi:alpha-L-fucosidase 2
MFPTLLLITSLTANTFGSDLVLRYDEDAQGEWEDRSLPIGNGYMGASIYGIVNEEQITFNEKSMWSGGPGFNPDYDGGTLPENSKVDLLNEIRTKLDEGDVDWVWSNMGGLKGDNDKSNGSFGSFQAVGNIFLDTGSTGDYSNYERTLDIEEAISTVTYTRDGVDFSREYFMSYPDEVMVIRYTADTANQIDLTLDFVNLQTTDNITVSNGLYTLEGHNTSSNMLFELQMQVLAEGGSVSNNSDNIVVDNANTVTIIVTAETDYDVEGYPIYKGPNPGPAVDAVMSAAIAKGYAQLKTDHIADYTSLFDRYEINLNHSASTAQTDNILDAYNGDNRFLEVLYMQYGRYLAIASSRPGTLPANLQGVWENELDPPWDADYHANINLQMNYWPADPTNLGELILPYADWVDKQRPRGRITAAEFGMDGWILGHEASIWGHNGLSTFNWAFFSIEGAGWLSRGIWDHYKFTLDEDYLENTAYPIMKEASEFWVDYLITDPDDGMLVASPSFSPEHGVIRKGVTYVQAVVWGLLSSTIEASEILDVDATFRATLQSKLDDMDPGLRIGSWGQFQEWKEDIDDPEDDHRHVNHVYGLHPGNQISPLDPATSQYADAIKVSLNARGDESTGWSRAWKLNQWARLHDGNRSHTLFSNLISGSTLHNLWDTHKPFQIDGNFGGTAGVSEMLLQSHMGFIHLLPALPDAWPTGFVKGAVARGAFEVDFEWNNGNLTNVTILSKKGQPLTVREGNNTTSFSTVAGQTYLLDGNLNLVDGENGTNVARTGNASQNSDSHGGEASRAIDGNTSGAWGQGSVTHTLGGIGDWWQVELNDNYDITAINIYNRSDSCCSERLSDYTVSILDTADNVLWTNTQTTEAGSPTTLPVAGVTGASKVLVTQNLEQPLSLAEVEVIGTVTETETGSNIAVNGSASQNSTAHSGAASRAIDGNTSGTWSQGSVTHTSGGVGDSWQVELDADYDITSINIHNRSDCCSERLSDYVVSVLDANSNELWSSTQTTSAGNPTTITVPEVSNARIIQVTQNLDEPLSLAEVEVFGTASSTEGYTYLGCYADQATRDLSLKPISNGTMSADICAAACTGYDYFATQNGNECRCGNDYGLYGSSSSCTVTCEDNDSEICGGSWANSIYSLTFE